MVKKIADWIVDSFALYIVAGIVPGIIIGDFVSALMAVFVIAFVNTFIKPVVVLLTLPLTFLTLGLFSFVLNAGLFLIASWISPGFRVTDFFSALLGALLFSVITSVLHRFTHD